MKIEQYLLFVPGRKKNLAALLSFCLLASCLLASCGGDSRPIEETETGTPIGFSVDILRQEGIQTRGEIITDISDMYVFASFTGANNWSPTDTPNFMYNQLMQKNGSGEWTYTPLKYWPASRDKISFFAYAPANLTDIVPATADKQGTQLTYTLPATETAKQDLLAGSCLDRTSSSGAVTFTMKHALTQVKFKIKNSQAAAVTAVLKGLEILMPGTGTLSFRDASSSASSGKTFDWGSYGAQATLTANALLGGDGKTIALDNTSKDAAVFFLIPLGDPSSLVTLRLTYTSQRISPPEEPVTFIVPMSPPATPAWEAGTTITYEVSVRDDRLEVEEVTSISDFTGGDTGVTGDITAT